MSFGYEFCLPVTFCAFLRLNIISAGVVVYTCCRAAVIVVLCKQMIVQLLVVQVLFAGEQIVQVDVARAAREHAKDRLRKKAESVPTQSAPRVMVGVVVVVALLRCHGDRVAFSSDL